MDFMMARCCQFSTWWSEAGSSGSSGCTTTSCRLGCTTTTRLGTTATRMGCTTAACMGSTADWMGSTTRCQRLGSKTTRKPMGSTRRKCLGASCYRGMGKTWSTMGEINMLSKESFDFDF
ncbi:unnamed protein product [Strongylus vulgaris]|uniref:Uncharacterized protein n=1 Tax=Strongylus vulgaris TaxID=40348 RepID=A0A3P7JFU0_STRVU|nr:unnamed protein product [Strongylus vulgaris]